MPWVTYMFIKDKPVFTADWQVWVCIGLILVTIAIFAIILWKTRD